MVAFTKLQTKTSRFDFASYCNTVDALMHVFNFAQNNSRIVNVRSAQNVAIVVHFVQF